MCDYHHLARVLAIGLFAAISPLPATAAFVLEGTGPITLPECVSPGTQPFADEPRDREESDTRAVCRVTSKNPDSVKPVPKPQVGVVPQK